MGCSRQFGFDPFPPNFDGVLLDPHLEAEEMGDAETSSLKCQNKFVSWREGWQLHCEPLCLTNPILMHPATSFSLGY